MAGSTKRQITESERAMLISKYRRPDGFIHCYIDDNIIEKEKDIQFDHIEPFTKVQGTYIDNMGPICGKHNLAKKDMTLSEYRDKLNMENLFKEYELKGIQLKLNDVLDFKYGTNYGYPIEYKYDINSMKIIIKYFQDRIKVNLPREEVYPVYQCPATEMLYFYALVPTRNILNDGKEGSELEMQPRPLRLDHLWNLYRHLRINTQLQPSICRIDKHDGSNIFIFDGQHKAAARIWSGKERIEVKVYIEPDKFKLMSTNLVAHDNLKQLRFYSSILAEKLSQLHGINWQKYIETPSPRSEKGFCNFLRYAENKTEEKAEKQIEAFLMTSILNDESNQFSKFVAPQDKTGKQYAISWDSLKKYYFRYFLAKPPLSVEIDSKNDFRNEEIKNNIRLLNILAKVILIDKWNPSEANDMHKKAERIFRPGAIMVWFPILRDVIYNKLDIYNPEDAKYLLFRNIPDDKWAVLENYINKMFGHIIWIDRDPNIDVVLGNKKLDPTRELFIQKGFTSQWILGIDSI